MAIRRAIALAALLAAQAWTIQPLQAQANFGVSRGTLVTVTTATAITDGPSILTHIWYGTPVAGTIKVFDLAAINCTGTPSTNQVTLTTLAAAEVPIDEPHNQQFTNGICVLQSANQSMTVHWVK